MTDNSSAIEQLETRLERGWNLIDQAVLDADERAVSRYTSRWLQLLQEYEDLLKSGAPRRSSSAGE